LLNDGAAIVFFAIFVERYLFELGIPDLGEDIDLAQGCAIFFRKSLGGVAVGLFFGLGLLLILYALDRRFNREENVVEVTATMAIAYIGFYVAEPVWQTSGVISTVTTGVVVKFLGRAMINDSKLLEDFWVLVEHLLNTVLFTLGGVVWGAVVASGEEEGIFTGRDWGYLILLYVLLHVIRALLFACFYPITVRIGLKTNRPETIFQVYGGLRGAVGIALALALDNEVRRVTDPDNDEDLVYIEQTRTLFAMVGGIAFMTLTINGTTAGPLLRKLGLADSTETREKIVQAYQVRFHASTIDVFVGLLTQQRFRHVNFALVKDHVPFIADMTKAQLMEAVEKYKDTTAPEDYQPPYLERVLPYLKDEEEQPVAAEMFRPSMYASVGATTEDTLAPLDPEAHARKLKHELRTKSRKKRRQVSRMSFMMKGEPMSAHELRALFISILRAAYERQIEHGELVDREFLAIALQQSLDFAADDVGNGKPLQDWKYVNIVDGPVDSVYKRLQHLPVFVHFLGLFRGRLGRVELKYAVERLKIERSLAFMAAHRWAQKFFRQEFENADNELSETGKIVLSESERQFQEAEQALNSCDPKDVEMVVSHKFCMILLNSGVHYITKLVKRGLLKEEEAEHMVKEIENDLDKVLSCRATDHPGEIDIEDDGERMRYGD